MTIEQLNELKEECTAEVMNSIASGNKEYLKKTEHVMKITLLYKDTATTSINKTQQIADLVSIGYQIVEIATEYKKTKFCHYCYDQRKPTEIIGNTLILVRTTYSENKGLIKSKIKSNIADKLLDLINRESAVTVWNLNCNAIEMFKSKDINWEQVLELHKFCKV